MLKEFLHFIYTYKRESGIIVHFAGEICTFPVKRRRKLEIEHAAILTTRGRSFISEHGIMFRLMNFSTASLNG